MDDKERAKNEGIKKFVADNAPTEKGERELIVRTGDAEKILYPNKVHLAGTIQAPAEFWAKRKALHNADKCHLTYDRNQLFIHLFVDEQFSERNYNVKGQLVQNPDLKKFQINCSKMYTTRELMGILKMNRIHFVDQEENKKIVTEMQKFKVKIEKIYEDETNLRGVDKEVKITEVAHAISEGFTLKMPLYKGGPVTKFRVEICLTATDGSVELWLESAELNELLSAQGNAMINEQLEKFKDIVCIEM